MGRRQKRRSNQNGNRNDAPVHYDPIIKENLLYERFYKELNIVPECEWTSFLECLRRPLPVTFRITSNRGYAEHIKNMFLKQLELINMKALKDELIEAVQIPWYPGGLAWQLNVSRNDIRQNDLYSALKDFFTTQIEEGNISRQEAVSMIPPVLLEIESHHKILDMCAAPGSKTAQLLEMLHEHNESDPFSSGFVLANDLDNSRCYTLVHQLKRLNSPNFAVINHNASVLPNIRYEVSVDEDTLQYTNLQYDRILCDVPCTGDGTIRKTPEIWMRWNIALAYNMHGIQTRIAQRGIELLAPGGIMVYSTCSMNPVENEAVIANLLQKWKGKIELEEVHLTGLQYRKGLTEWKLISKDGKDIYDSFEEVPSSLHTLIRPGMFAPKEDDLHLDRCMRLLPHVQDTGAFFIAVLRKKQDSIGDAPEPSHGSKFIPGYKRQRFYFENPFIFLNEAAGESLLNTIRSSYDVDESFPSAQLMIRNVGNTYNTVYFVSKELKKIISINSDRIKFVNLGLRMFSKTDFGVRDKNVDAFRICQEGINVALKYFKSRIFRIDLEDFMVVLQNAFPALSMLSAKLQEQLMNYDAGSVIMLYEPDSPNSRMPIAYSFVAMLGTKLIRPFISHLQRKSALCTFYEDNKVAGEVLARVREEELIMCRKQRTDDEAPVPSSENQ